MELYNTELVKLTKAGKGTWFTAPWLYAEYVHCPFTYAKHLMRRVYRCYL